MTKEQIRAVVLEVLASVAPEVEPAKLRGDLSLREQVDLDSVDVLNYVTGLGTRFGIDIPENDYPHLFRLETCVRYLAERVKHAHRAPPSGARGA